MKKITLLSLLVVIIDRLTKILVTANVNLNSSIVLINDFLSITYVKNIGAAFSILEGNTILLIVVSIIALILIYLFLIKNHKLSSLEIFSYSLLIGGIIGNLIDRILYHHVIDFIHFEIFNYHFPIFNIADVAIVIGIMIMILIILKEDKNAKNNNW